MILGIQINANRVQKEMVNEEFVGAIHVEHPARGGESSLHPGTLHIGYLHP